MFHFYAIALTHFYSSTVHWMAYSRQYKNITKLIYLLSGEDPMWYELVPALSTSTSDYKPFLSIRCFMTASAIGLHTINCSFHSLMCYFNSVLLYLLHIFPKHTNKIFIIILSEFWRVQIEFFFGRYKYRDLRSALQNRDKSRLLRVVVVSSKSSWKIRQNSHTILWVKRRVKSHRQRYAIVSPVLYKY